MKVLVMFGSKSDEKTYNQIAENLGKLDIDYELRVASAHKTPQLVENIIKDAYSVIVA